MPGPLAAPLIGAVGSLLGGLFNKPKNEYVVPDYKKIRSKAEAAGFNPLFAMANAPGQVVQSGGYMGSAVSDAAMIMADAVAKMPGAGKLSQVQAENRALSKKVQSLTLRPKIGGIYAQRGVTPNLKQALGVSDAAAPSQSTGLVVAAGVSGSAGSSDTGTYAPIKLDPLDPTREIDRKKISSEAGWSVIDNPWLGSFRIPTFGDEPIDLVQLPVIAGSYLADRAMNLGGWAASSGNLSGAQARRMREYKNAGQRYLLSQKRPKSRGTVKPRATGNYPFMAISP